MGDNLVYNAHVLCNLRAANEQSVFNKLIVLQIGAILEAALSEIIFRAQNYNLEGVPNISEKDRSDIEGKKIDKFSAVIDVMKKYGVLNGLGDDIYGQLHKLRKYRNKMHIQDNISIEGVPLDEGEAFSDELCSWAIALNLKVIKYLSANLQRPPELHGYVAPLLIPVE